VLEQRGDHACSEWNDQGCLFGGRSERNDCGGNTATGWCQATTAMRMVAATRPFRYTLGWALFLLLSVFDCMAMESQCCLVCKYYNDSQCIATSPLELLFFISFLTQIFFLFLIWCYLLHRISYFGCSKHHVQFSLMLHVTIILVCFTLVVPSLTPSPASTHPPQHHQLPAAYTIIPAPPPYWKIHFLPVMTWRKNWV